MADFLTEICRSSADGLVLALNAPYGYGKSTFLEMWRLKLSSSGIPVVHFNAWESDFSDDPLVALIAEIDAQFDSLRAESSDLPSARQHLNTAKRIGGALLRAAIPTVVRLATGGVLKGDEFSEEALAKLAEESSKHAIERYELGRKSVHGFRDALRSMAADIGRTEGKPTVPLVFIVDELDRCRPTYAVQLLERLKHFFAVEGIVFVLAVDRGQLSSCISALYGSGFDPEGYLRRFFDLEMSLPQPSMESFAAAQIQRFGLDAYFAARKSARTSYDRQQLLETMSALLTATDASLRDCERCFAMVSLAARATAENQLLFAILLAAMVVVKVRRPSLYREWVAGRATSAEILALFEASPAGAAFLRENYGAALEGFLLACDKDQGRDSDRMKKYVAALQDPNATDELKSRASLVQEVRRELASVSVRDLLELMVKRIDLASQQAR